MAPLLYLIQILGIALRALQICNLSSFVFKKPYFVSVLKALQKELGTCKTSSIT